MRESIPHITSRTRDGKIGGMEALLRLEEGVAEIKRMYIRPEHRSRGYGRMILNKLIDSAKEFGYSTLRLDTGTFMGAAIGLTVLLDSRRGGLIPGLRLSEVGLTTSTRRKSSKKGS